MSVGLTRTYRSPLQTCEHEQSNTFGASNWPVTVKVQVSTVRWSAQCLFWILTKPAMTWCNVSPRAVVVFVLCMVNSWVKVNSKVKVQLTTSPLSLVTASLEPQTQVPCVDGPDTD